MSAPHFWKNPLRYWHWAARERPALFWSCVLAGLAPAVFITAPPIRRFFNDKRPAPYPTTYPIPPGPRKQLTGYDDDTEN